MAKTVALAARRIAPIALRDVLSSGLVVGCALALIMAGRALPF